MQAQTWTENHFCGVCKRTTPFELQYVDDREGRNDPENASVVHECTECRQIRFWD